MEYLDLPLDTVLLAISHDIKLTPVYYIFYKKKQIIKWINKCQSWGLLLKVNMLLKIAYSFLGKGWTIGKH